MQVNEILNEQTHKCKQTVVVFSGRFQPPHCGHVQTWHTLIDEYKCDTFIATSNIVNNTSPFNFMEKQALFELAGIPTLSIVHVKNPYSPREIMEDYDLSNTALIFAVSKKDMEHTPRFKFGVNKNGAKGYMQPLMHYESLQPASKHGYITTVPTLEFSINDNKISSSTELRNLFANATHTTQQQMMYEMYGAYSPKLHNILKEKLNTKYKGITK